MRFQRYLLSQVRIELQEGELGRSAVVFSPHPDDETLGCGGTIVRKKRAGADIKVVVMTGGSGSHSHLMSKDKLETIRASEGINASRSLGLDASDVFALGFQDGSLSGHIASAADRVAEVLMRYQPEEIFIPYSREPLSLAADHVAATKIVLSVLRRALTKATVYEYPVWFWLQWPWVGVPLRFRRGAKTIVRNTVDSLLGFYLLRDFRYSVDIGDVLDVKRAALYQHRSQMTRLIPDPRWTTLADVSNGDFLECFFQDHEVFYRYKVVGNS
jgi:LmbE family N-acetylglucosaminyl deacetylase